MRVCSVEGCRKPHRARGWCHNHWRHWRKYGNPLEGKFHDLIRGPLTEHDPRHGTVNGYVNLGCRQECCRSAWAVYKREWNNASDERRERLNASERNRRKKTA